MKFIKILPLLMVLALCGCGKESSFQSAPLAVSGLPPVAWIAQEIGGKYITSVSLLPEGRSPHDYAPGPSVLRRAAAAKLFFSCGMPFEKSAEKALNCEIVDVTKNISRIMFDTSGNAHEHHSCSHTHADGTSCSSDGSDPHVWLSCQNACVIAENIAQALGKAFPEHKTDFENNLAAFKTRFAELKNKTSSKLAPYAGRTFFVYHPAFGYFAKEFGLKQQSIELGGREVSAARLAEVIRHAKAENAKVIFTQKQFNPRNSMVLAKETGGRCVGMDALAFDIEKNIREMTSAIIDGFGGNKK